MIRTREPLTPYERAQQTAKLAAASRAGEVAGELNGDRRRDEAFVVGAGFAWLWCLAIVGVRACGLPLWAFGLIAIASFVLMLRIALRIKRSI